MPRPEPLFVIGSKRSGSTLAVNLLNAHPRVFASHESDSLWILYQARNGPPATSAIRWTASRRGRSAFIPPR
jgi:LPS sulfotransferase NodH